MQASSRQSNSELTRCLRAQPSIRCKPESWWASSNRCYSNSSKQRFNSSQIRCLLPTIAELNLRCAAPRQTCMDRQWAPTMQTSWYKAATPTTSKAHPSPKSIKPTSQASRRWPSEMPHRLFPPLSVTPSRVSKIWPGNSTASLSIRL